MKIQNMKMRFLLLALTLCFSALAATAQTPNFTYQGRFTDSTLPQPTNGTYNMQFTLFDAASGGSQVGATVTIPAVQVVNGVFTVSLDYGASPFAGAARFLEITIGNTVLSPRQAITSVPYAIRARNATLATNSTQLGGVDADQYVTGQVVRSVNNIADNVTLAAGNNITITPSGNTLTIASTGGGGGINNQTSLQTGANFNIDGSGAANSFTAAGTVSGDIVNAQTNYSIGGTTVFSTPNTSSVAVGQLSRHNLFIGGTDSTFVGYKTGQAANLFSSANTFVGSQSGLANTSGKNNSFFGTKAGFSMTDGEKNSYFGTFAGSIEESGLENSLFGYATTGLGDKNVVVGANAIAVGFANTLIGAGTQTELVGVNNSTAIGAGAGVYSSNTIVLGTNAETTKIPGAFSVSGKAKVLTLGAAGSTSLCRNSLNEISTCTAGNFAEQAKNSATIQNLGDENLQLKNQLQIQQKQISEQADKYKQLQKQIDDLRKIVCGISPAANICGK